jgi:hypothetical protein
MSLIGGQCRKSNLVCHGYPIDLKFVRYSPTRVGSSRVSATITNDQDDVSRTPSPTRLVARTTSPALSMDQALMNSAVDTYMFDAYWHSFFPKAKAEERQWIPVGDRVSSWIPAGWIFEMRDYCASDMLIRTGLQANAYATWGKRTADKRLSVASMQAYSMVLQEVHRCLQDPEKRKQDRLLAACKFLALYEVWR